MSPSPFSKNDITLIGIEHRPKNTFQIGISENLKKIIPKVISIICEETKNKCK
jgi:Ni,Fe-hydrogenase maturation factor